MASNLKKVALLGAFEIQSETELPVRDGLILGSRKLERGFVLETSRENIEQIVALTAPARPGMPKRMLSVLGAHLRLIGATLVRVELLPLPLPAGQEEDDDEGSFVQGYLVYRHERNGRKLLRLPMSATEAIQISLVENLPLMAEDKLLQLNVSHFLAEIDEFGEQQQADARQFRSFVDSVTASDFTRFYQAKQDGDEEA